MRGEREGKSKPSQQNDFITQNKKCAASSVTAYSNCLRISVFVSALPNQHPRLCSTSPCEINRRLNVALINEWNSERYLFAMGNTLKTCEKMFEERIECYPGDHLESQTMRLFFFFDNVLRTFSSYLKFKYRDLLNDSGRPLT